jgi:hypothetical protein
MLGETWAYMTPDYIYKEMTWNEISDAIDYVYRYKTDERHFGKGAKVKLNDWLYNKKDNLASDLRKAIGDMKRGS